MNNQLSQLSLAEKEALVLFLSQFVTDARQAAIKRALDGRTHYLAVVLENIYQPHNASAVLRTCDCFGIQNVHIIEAANEYRVNPEVSLGAAQWLTLNRYSGSAGDDTTTCLTALKAQGYQIVATTLREESISLEDLPVDRPLALCFGTEEDGLSPDTHAFADHFITIPMVGFTQSFNISVSAAICLYDLTQKLRSSQVDWRLTAEERTDLSITWLVESVTNGEAMVRHFLKNRHQLS